MQPPEGKTPHVKPVEVGGGAQWPSKPTTSTPSKDMGSTEGQPPRKSTQGTLNIKREREQKWTGRGTTST